MWKTKRNSRSSIGRFAPPRTTSAELRIIPSRQAARRMMRQGRVKNQATHTTSTKATSSTSSKATQTKTPDDSCKTKVTPACLQAIYGIPSEAALNRSSNLFIASFVGESADPADLKASGWYRLHSFNQSSHQPQKFLGEFRPDVDDKTTFRVKDLDGGSNNRVQATIEAVSVVKH